MNKTLTAITAAEADAMDEPAREEPTPKAGDHELVEKARQGDLKAFDELVRRYESRVYATIYHMTANREDASDLTQEAFIRAFRRLKTFRGQCNFYTWLYRIAVNHTINFLKQRKGRTMLSLDDLDQNAERDPDLVKLISDRTPRRDLSLQEIQQRLNAALMKLSPTHRLVITLHDIQGVPQEEIGRIMDCRQGTVRSRLFYARQQLQALLSDLLE